MDAKLTLPEADACYKILQAKDARYDGQFFTAVSSTGIYCRPVCKVRTPKRENCSFFRLAAQAEGAGFRPCLRCRPELAPRMAIAPATTPMACAAQGSATPANAAQRQATGFIPAASGAALHGTTTVAGSGGGDVLETPWSTQDASSILARQAAALLDSAEGWGDGGVATLAQLAVRMGVSDRHVRRIFESELGVSPLQYLQTRRLLCAKQLLTDTDLPVTQVAAVSGFASLRRFNAAFAQHYALNPTQLRKSRRTDASESGGKGGATNRPRPNSTVPHRTTKKIALGAHSICPAADSSYGMGKKAQDGLTLRLSYRPPYDAAAMLGFFAKRWIAGVECWQVAGDARSPGADGVASATSATSDNSDTSLAQILWGRTLQIQHAGKAHPGWLMARFVPERHQVEVQLATSLLDVLPLVMGRVRALFDLDADPLAIDAVLAPLFPGNAGLRVPGTVDGFELAVRAVLGQQITVAAARTLARRLVERFGEPISTPWPELNRLFPGAQTLAQASADALGQLGIVKTRQAAIVALAQAVVRGELQLVAGADPLRTMTQLRELPGIGDWTAQYIAMRALRWPDAFPAGDVALHKALGVLGHKQAAKESIQRAEPCRPWRSYAVLRAWQSLAQPGTARYSLAKPDLTR